MSNNITALNADMPGLGSDVLDDESMQALEKETEQFIGLLLEAAQSSRAAREYLNTPLGKDLRKYIISTKQFSMFRLAKSGTNDEERAEAQKDFDVICGVEQFFANLIQGGKVAKQQLQVKGVE